MASAPLFTGVEEELICPISIELFTDPVTLDCGHNFCWGCITEYCEKWEDMNEDPECPVCRVRIKDRNFQLNWQLVNIVEKVRQAKKCAQHINLCGKHNKELNLFCKEDEDLLCVACERSPEHRPHTVLLLEEAALEYKDKIQAQIPYLEQERLKLVDLKLDEEQRNDNCLKQLEEQKQKITSAFEQMHIFLEEKEGLWLIELTELEKEIKERQDENMTRLSEEISYFSDLIKDMKEKCQQLPAEFLQDIKSTLSRANVWKRLVSSEIQQREERKLLSLNQLEQYFNCQEGQLRQQLELFPGLEWRLRSCYPNSAVFEKAMEKFEESLNQAPNKVSVTLDPDTAHLWLTLSEDLKTFRMEDKYQDLPDNPERFDTMSCVLGRERFTSGRHCWEVEVEKEGWAVGVAQESLPRKGCFTISPHKGIWAVGRDSFQLWAYAYDGNAVLPLSRDLRKIRVFLDYEEGQVEFFDADTDNWMFTFTPGSFFGEGIRPFFCVGEGAHLQC